MRLSDAARDAEFAVLRDGEFRNLGFLHDSPPAALVFLESPRFLKFLADERVAAVLTTRELAGRVPGHLALAVCNAPRTAFAELHNRLADTEFYWERFETSRDESAAVHPSAYVAPANVRIGAGATIAPQAAILERCEIGENVQVGAAAVLGGVGFQTVRSSRPMLEMRHAGGLIVGAGAHILPGAVIATGLFRRSTEIGEEARVGARAFLSHGVRLGARSFVGHGAIINGNVTIGEGCWIGPGAVLSNDLTIGDGAFITLGAVVARCVPAGEHVSGNFAVPHKRFLRAFAAADRA